MSDTLRSRLIRLAHQERALRPHLLPILERTAFSRLPKFSPKLWKDGGRYVEGQVYDSSDSPVAVVLTDSELARAAAQFREMQDTYASGAWKEELAGMPDFLIEEEAAIAEQFAKTPSSFADVPVFGGAGFVGGQPVMLYDSDKKMAQAASERADVLNTIAETVGKTKGRWLSGERIIGEWDVDGEPFRQLVMISKKGDLSGTQHGALFKKFMRTGHDALVEYMKEGLDKDRMTRAKKWLRAVKSAL